MTNDELNRTVAALRGWKAPTFSTTRLNPYGNGIDVVNIPFPPPDYCTDPAAWGSLFVELAGEGLVPMLEYDGLGTYVASVGRYGRPGNTPGEALCLALVASRAASAPQRREPAP